MGVLSVETVLRILIVILVLPLMCGSFFAARLRRYERRSFFLNAYVFGWIALFALFELICTPYVVTLGKFSSFCRVFQISVLAGAGMSAAAAAVVLYRGRRRAVRVREADAEAVEKIEEADAEAVEKIEEADAEAVEKTEEADAGKEAGEARTTEPKEVGEVRSDMRGGGVAGYASADEADAPMEKTTWQAWLLWGAVIVSVFVQMVFFYYYNHMNGDDSYYIAQSVITDLMDTMYQRDAYTGTPMGLDVRHALSVLPVFVTWVGRVCGLHPATAAHAVLGPAFLALCYGVYALLGKALFAKRRNIAPLFVLFVQIWYLWGNVSIFTPETFLYTRTWQGKAVFANIILPLAFYLLYRLLTKWRAIDAVLLLFLSLAGIFTTTASVYLLSMLYGIAALYCLITQRQWKKFFGIAACIAPAFLYGLIYIWLLRTW